MVFIEKLRRPTALAAAALLLVASTIPLLASQTASAYTLLGEREIMMESSVVDLTGLDYRVDFNVSDATNIGGIVVTFCAGTPIIGDATCVNPAGFEIATNAFSNDGGDVDVTGFSAAVSNVTSDASTGNNTFTLTNAVPASATAGQSVRFVMSNVTNPSTTNQSFYARIMVYTTDAPATNYTTANDPAATQTPAQAGGIALSTAEVITIESKVQERLEFCIHTTATVSLVNANADCSTLADPIVLGDANGVLSSADPSVTDEARFGITTNASAGATVRMKGTTLDSGTFTIDEIGGVAAGSAEGTEQFGMCVYGEGAAGLVSVTPYDSANCNTVNPGQSPTADGTATTFAFDVNVTDGTESVYGDSIATKAAGAWSTGVLVFIGNISDVTEPGIYTTTLDFIATGRY